MLEFRVIELSDKDWIKRLLSASDYRGCEYCFANNFAWRRLYETKITRFKDFYIACSFASGTPFFIFPSGSGDIREAIDEMKRFAEERNSPLVIGSITPDIQRQLTEIYGADAFEITVDEDAGDYIYNASDLINLAGKKYHSKRNHLKKFCALDYEYAPLTEKDFDDCISFSTEFYLNSNGYDVRSSVSEQFAINAYFTYFHELDLSGGVLRADGRIAAFTIAERINSDTLGIHIEKADTSFDGAYAAINNFHAKDAAVGYAYINREEDLGLEGLRRAKRSYFPAFILEKNIATFK